MQNYSRDLCWELGLAFCSTQLSTQVPSLTFKKCCRRPCHAWDLGLGTMCEVVSPNFHDLNGWNYMDWPQVTWGLGLGTPCELALRFQHDRRGNSKVNGIKMEIFTSTPTHHGYETHNQMEKISKTKLRQGAEETCIFTKLDLFESL